MFKDICNLISITTTEDNIGQSIETEISREVFCNTKSIMQNEFFQAAQTGIKPSRCIIIKKIDYEEETLLEFEGKKYSVYRTYDIKNENIELYCEVRIGG